MNFDSVSSVATKDMDRAANDTWSESTGSNWLAGTTGAKNSTTFERSGQWPNERLQTIFDRLVLDWMKETRFSNSMDDIQGNRHLATILSLGSAVVPLILLDLQKSPKHWFLALHNLTGADPIQPAHAGNLEAMRQDWLAWGRQSGYLTDDLRV